ncbi:hypothetical protein J45TS6_40480 [Paenibacillus sp. J45TS6]|uniref:hypothetical protein n=1 Tax=unclassified Paenibacillus TaxID=185978 RepID=UPI001B1F05C9|nr:hypothetical protein [Paenibacillus sp. J45TS6]GIP45589.1 hypothetical protein J45TS6_40480 [Paenibacillus sp. J45TS6]
MQQQTGDKVRNQEDNKNNSPEQQEKVKKHEDIEPQAENWNPRDLPDPNKKD